MAHLPNEPLMDNPFVGLDVSFGVVRDPLVLPHQQIGTNPCVTIKEPLFDLQSGKMVAWSRSATVGFVSSMDDPFMHRVRCLAVNVGIRPYSGAW